MAKGRPKTQKPEINVNQVLAENTAQKNLIENQKQQIANLQKTIDVLAAKYSQITSYIKESTRVYHRGILMALEEGENK